MSNIARIGKYLQKHTRRRNCRLPSQHHHLCWWWNKSAVTGESTEPLWANKTLLKGVKSIPGPASETTGDPSASCESYDFRDDVRVATGERQSEMVFNDFDLLSTPLHLHILLIIFFIWTFYTLWMCIYCMFWSVYPHDRVVTSSVCVLYNFPTSNYNWAACFRIWVVGNACEISSTLRRCASHTRRRDPLIHRVTLGALSMWCLR